MFVLPLSQSHKNASFIFVSFFFECDKRTRRISSCFACFFLLLKIKQKKIQSTKRKKNRTENKANDKNTIIIPALMNVKKCRKFPVQTKIFQRQSPFTISLQDSINIQIRSNEHAKQ